MLPGLLVSDTFTPTGQQMTESLIINYTQVAVEVSSSLELVALVHWSQFTRKDEE